MNERFDVRRWAAWTVLILLAIVLARQTADPRPELAELRQREARLTHRFNFACADKAAASLQAPSDDDHTGAIDPWESVCMAEELRQVQVRIAELESRWWW